MPAELFAFQWPVYEHGHEWTSIKIGSRDEWQLRGNIVPGHDWPEIFYDPLTAFPALHRIFASIDASDRDAILEFANQYGMLGLNKPIPSHGGAFGIPAETLTAWKDEVWDMRQAVELWEMVRSSERAGLSKLFAWKDDVCTYKNKCSWHATAEPISPCDMPLREGDVRMAARIYYTRLANKKLTGNASAQLRHDLGTGKDVVQIIPRTLLAALWLQFVRGAEGNYLYPKCKECQRPFAVSPEERGHRRSRKFCTDACKAKNYRTRKAATLTTKKGK